jgi:site-specific recombinase XerD
MVMKKSNISRKLQRKLYQDYEIEVFDLQTMKEGFLFEQDCRGNSRATIQYYEGNITRFIAYLEEQDLPTDTSSISKEQIQKYILYLRNTKKWAKTAHIKSGEYLVSKSIQTYIRALKAWAAWMESEGYVEEGTSVMIKLPKATKRLKEILSEEEIQDIMKFLEAKPENHYRDLLIIMILLECGLRLEEVTKLKLKNIDLKQNTMKVLGKGDKERIVSYGVNLQRTIFKYINQERPEPANKRVESLFLKNDGTAITQDTVKQLFRRIKEKTEMDKLHPHLCRHTYCTMYLANGGDIFSLKMSTGHESFEILNNYVHLANSISNIKNKSLSLLDEMKLKV